MPLLCRQQHFRFLSFLLLLSRTRTSTKTDLLSSNRFERNLLHQSGDVVVADDDEQQTRKNKIDGKPEHEKTEITTRIRSLNLVIV